MIWQDMVITIANLVFTYSLVNQVSYGFKVKKGLLTLTTSVLTATGLYIMSFAFLSLFLYYSALVSFINATLWYILFMQRIMYKKA